MRQIYSDSVEMTSTTPGEKSLIGEQWNPIPDEESSDRNHDAASTEIDFVEDILQADVLLGKDGCFCC